MSPKYKPVFRSPILLAGLVLIMILSACSPPVDSDIGTDSIHAKMSVECRSNGTSDVEVKLSVGSASGSDIDLGDDDRLRVSAAGDSQLLTRDKVWPFTIRYLATLDTDDPETPVQIDLERDGGAYASAPDSNVSLPARISILQPNANDTFSRLETFPVSWDTVDGSDELRITFDITCEEDGSSSAGSRSYLVADTGSKSFRVADLLQDWDLGEDPSCTAEVILTRTNEGTLSGEYMSGEITAVREASVFININP